MDALEFTDVDTDDIADVSTDDITDADPLHESYRELRCWHGMFE